MNNSPETIQSTPSIPPQITQMEKNKKEAFAIILDKIKRKIEEIGTPTSLVVYGREYPIRDGSVSDKVVAEAQLLHSVAEKILEEVRGHDYYQEMAAAKLAELFNENELFTGRYAELLEHFPALASEIKKMVPSLSHIQSSDEKYLIH